MSGSGEIIAPIAGAAFLLPAAAVAVAAGAVVLTGRAVAAGVRFAAEEAERARQNRLGKSINSYTDRLDEISSDLSSKLAESAQNVQLRYEKELNEIKEMASDKADLSDYIKQCAEAEERMFEELERGRNEIETEAAATLTEEKRKISNDISKKRTALEASVKEFGDDMKAREERSRAAAAEALEQARASVGNFRELYGGSEMADRLYNALNSALADAEKRYGEKQYEAVIVTAYSAIEQSATGTADILEHERRSAHNYSKCTAVLQEIRNYLTNMSSIEYTFSDTNSGEPRIVGIDDFSIYFGDEWQRTVQTADRIGAVLEGTSHSNFTYEELSDLFRELCKAKNELLDGMQTAYKRLYNALLRDEWADTIAQAYADMGYYELEPDEDYDPLKKTVMLFENDDGSDMVRVTLRPEMTGSGDLEIKIDVDDHAEDLGRKDLESERTAQREEICERLTDSPLGRKIGIMARQTCKSTTRNRNAF